jgi:hypothetical protein
LTLEGTDGPVAVLDVEGFPIMRQWFIVHPRSKELSLVAQEFLQFALAIEPRMRQRIEGMLPKLGQVKSRKKQPAKPAAKNKVSRQRPD